MFSLHLSLSQQMSWLERQAPIRMISFQELRAESNFSSPKNGGTEGIGTTENGGLTDFKWVNDGFKWVNDGFTQRFRFFSNENWCFFFSWVNDQRCRFKMESINHGDFTINKSGYNVHGYHGSVDHRPGDMIFLDRLSRGLLPNWTRRLLFDSISRVSTRWITEKLWNAWQTGDRCSIREKEVLCFCRWISEYLKIMNDE